jgi:cold shock CspA family protein
MVVAMSMIGTVSTLCRAEEYAIITPSDGGPPVFVHADEFGQDWRDLAPGMDVRFSSLQGIRGPKAYNVTVLSRTFGFAGSALNDLSTNPRPTTGDDSEYSRELNGALETSWAELIAALISTVPEISPEQVAAVCNSLRRS